VLTNAAAAVAVGIIATGIVIGFDPAVLVGEVTAAMVDLAASVNPGPGAAPTAADLEPIVRFNVAILPASAAIMGLAVVVLDLYLGALSVRFSDRLKRPDERMWSVALPAAVPALLGVATVLAFAPGNVGYVAEAIAGAESVHYKAQDSMETWDAALRIWRTASGAAAKAVFSTVMSFPGVFNVSLGRRYGISESSRFC
jgi:hypothetical protein